MVPALAVMGMLLPTMPAVALTAVDPSAPHAGALMHAGPRHQASRPVTMPAAVSRVTRRRPAASRPAEIAKLGPGNRILGADISSFQHTATSTFPGGAPIDFHAMYAAGVRFVYIKGSDAYDTADVTAGSWFAADRKAAQAAGLYTGMYHFAYLPDSTDRTIITTDARAQALKAVLRVVSAGGLNRRDLAPALDVETACIRWSGGVCSASASPANATLWALTWLRAVARSTGRTPLIYSFPNFLATNMLADPELADYPLWIAQPVGQLHAADSLPGTGSDGTCYLTAWTSWADCSLRWTAWQYATASGDDFGVPGSADLDLDVFNGSSRALRALTAGRRTPAGA